MDFDKVIKKLSLAVIYGLSLVLIFTIYFEMRDHIPGLGSIGPLYALIGPIVLSTFAFILALIKGIKLPLKALSLIAMFFCNVFCYGGASAQVGLIIVIVLDAALSHIRLSQFSNIAVVVIAFLLCGALASLTAPFIGRIKTPKMVTDFQESWFSIIEDESNPEPVKEDDSNEEPVVIEVGRLMGNVITNEMFDPTDPTMTMAITSTYPLDKMMVFACYDYNPAETRFEFASPDILEEDSSDSFFDKAKNGESLPYIIEIEDNSIYKDMRFVPYCDFRTSDDVTFFKDSYAFLGDGGHPKRYSYAIDPDSYYATSSPGYGSYVASNYTKVPDEFKPGLTKFLIDHNIQPFTDYKYETVAAVLKIFDEEYTYSNNPPELPAGEDPVMWFINESKTGYSKHFAAAQVLLLRAAGIYARYSYGYEMDINATGTLMVSEGDAMAYCQVYIDGRWQLASDLKRPEKDNHPAEDEQGGTQLPDIPIDSDMPALEGDDKEEKTFDFKWILYPLAVFAIIAGIYFTLRYIARRFKPNTLQRINGSYKAIKKFYFVRKAIGETMLKVRYSKEGPEEEDAVILEREVSAAKSQFRYQRKYFILLRFSIFAGWQRFKSVVYNMFNR